MKKKTVEEVKIHNYEVCACKSQDFAQSQTISEWSHDRETVTFRNSDRDISNLITFSAKKR